tara:strand:+ start:606 stop:965 length:360 start_codon:yes stop_codon:yes gene_type:complete
MLLSQQAELASIDSNEVLIALSPNWENMIKSRKIIIENAVKKVFGNQIKLNFSNKKANTTSITKSQKQVSKNLNENNPRQNNDLKESNTLPKNPQKELYENGSKNLANFFNGEIIDIEE